MFHRAALDLSPPVSHVRGRPVIAVAGSARGGGHSARPPSPAGPGAPAPHETFPVLAAAFGVGLATAHRYATEVIALAGQFGLPVDLTETVGEGLPGDLEA
ncbi:hypothetical protein [Thermomonospora cellulosilytica]|uniref:Uncharacterized protein n=1 Tax=Thermomonospora cellulosilytica TaxID=1411118 RepID=A0A7W3R746_9ACTN|nr:hypothetical protein [Thermomonospora cellulosilytica]MBA9002878.1 hypothetical protein [Thermomonospora cellulosilytica]